MVSPPVLPGRAIDASIGHHLTRHLRVAAERLRHRAYRRILILTESPSDSVPFAELVEGLPTSIPERG